MTARADLPPITRKLNADLIATQRRNSVDAETATALRSLTRSSSARSPNWKTI